MIEAGLDGLHAVQPCCHGMDLRMLKQKYGEKIVFNGAIDSQHVLIEGPSAEFVRDKTREVLTAAAAGVPGRLDDPEPQIILLNLGDSSVDWQVRVWANTEDYWVVWDAATKAVKTALDRAGLGIPFPQMDVHHDSLAPTGA